MDTCSKKSANSIPVAVRVQWGGGVRHARIRALSTGGVMRRFVLSLALGLGVAALARAADPPAKPTLALMGGRIIDGYEGTPIEDGVVLIAGERIVAVGPRSRVVVPAGTPTIDTRGMSVLPGLADMHVHLMIVGHGDYEHWDKTYRSRFRREIMPAAAKQLLESGVTFARDLGRRARTTSSRCATGSRRARFPGRGSSSRAPSSSTPRTPSGKRSTAGASTARRTRAPRCRRSWTPAWTSSS